MNRWRRVATDTGEMIGTALVACVIAGLLASTVGAAALLRTLQFGPPVGEILVFGPYAQPAPVWKVEAVRALDHRRCSLKPAVMAEAHGSLVVERRSVDGSSFQVHWAGGPTSDGGGSCGNAVDVTLRLAEMQTLVNASAAARHYLIGF